MNKTRHYIRTLLLMLLLLAGGGTGNEAWAKDVRYHILTLPFDVKDGSNSGYWRTNIRVEALLVISNSDVVGLPEQYKSPLAKGFKYYKSWATPEYNYLFDRLNNTHLLEVKHYLYSGSGQGTEISAGSDIDADISDIYVTYVIDTDYADTKELYLDGRQDYNITVGGDKFLCYNRSRNNRIANANAGAITGEYLASTQFVVPEAGTGKNQLGFNWSTDQYAGAHGVHMGFWFTGNTKDGVIVQDPYNITLMTAYVGNETYHKDPVEGLSYYKPYRGATLFAKMNSNVNGKGTDEKMWFGSDNDRHYYGTNEENWQTNIDEWPGYYRHTTQPLFNSVALLNHPGGKGYVFVASKINQGVGSGTYKEWAPNSSGNYATLTNDNNNPFMSFKTFSNSPIIDIYKIRTYTVKIKLDVSGEILQKDLRWSDAMASEKIIDHIPEALKRKYCSYKAYSDEQLTAEITTFDDAKAANNGNVIWLDYTVLESLPFTTLPKNGCYEDAQWYTMRMNGKAEQKNIAYDNGSRYLITADGSGKAQGSNNTTELHKGENSAEAMVAFIGDPYELKIISRAASESAGANRFIGCATGATDNRPLNTDKEDTSGNIITWEMVYENTDMGNFLLRQFNTYDNPKYIGWYTDGANKPVVYSSATPTNNNRIRVVELEKVTYTYHIVRANGDIAVEASATHDLGKALSSWEDIPEVIRSPFLESASTPVTYYAKYGDAILGNNAIINAPYDSYRDIYVRYGIVPIEPGKTYNVRINNDYIYTDEGDIIKSKAMLEGEEAGTGAFKWELDYSDPYHMTINNKGKNKYVCVEFSDLASITWSDSPSSYFVAKSGALDGTYEVMAATGDGVDASKIYYNIGRPAENTVKLYSNSSYQYGNAVLRFQLIATDASDVVYHLIDKAGKELLQAKTRQKSTDPPSFPPEYHSPLVSTYYYYKEDDFTHDLVKDTYTLKTPTPTQQTNVSLGHIYVTYKVNDLVNLKSGQLYLLKYEAGEEFRQEDGSNGLLPDPEDFKGTDEEKTARYKAVYPYVNGDGNFFVYGENERELQQASASTRTRWVWYVQSPGDEGDPYHVTIKSYQDEPFPYINYSYYNAYFMTYKPAGYSKVVTTLAWPGMSEETATEYMVLGSEGQYQLVTTYEIDGSRHVVNSFEQYWKTWDTIRKIIYGESSAKEKDSDPIIIPNDTKYPYENPTEETLRDYLENTLKWHSYEKWAYAKRWNGYNNGYSTTTGTPDKKKGWETIEHWYQTVKMGEGYFDFVKTSVDPVLILLDQHGWEIMRKPLPSSPDDPLKDAKYEAIRAYNSPMVKEYKFYSDNTKATGYHKYIPKTPITVDGKQYVSTSLTSLPPYETAVNVKDKKGNLNDQYVTYTVKDEYAQAYSCSYSNGVATEIPKPFLIQQGDYFVYESDGKIKTDVPAGGMNQYITDNIGQLTESGTKKNELWYIRPNRNIDTEMGMSYGTVTDITKKEPWTQEVTETYYETNHLNGFDPYNIQIQSVSKNTKYLVTNATGATVVEGSMEATYDSNSPAISLDTQVNVVPGAGTDNTTLRMTNATFMAVQDENGNMQLMPRFDHSHRMSDFSTLTAPTDVTTYTKLYRPVVYDYRIIDNDGHESLRYQSGGDLLPQTPDHFKSPLAKNFKYYATATKTVDPDPSIEDTYSNITNEIEESLDGANLEDDIVYIRYEYDEDADNLNILKGNWLTMQLDNKTTQYTTVSTPGIYSSLPSYSSTANVGELDSQAKKLTKTGDYYFKVGDDYYEVKVSGIAPEALGHYESDTENNETWDALPSDSPYKLTATDDIDLDYKAKRLTETGTYHFKVPDTTPNTYKYIIVTVKSAYIESHALYTSTQGTFSSQWNNSKPLVVNADGKKWQWKFSHNSQPDPYAIYIYNRSQSPAGTTAIVDRFALLSHSEGDYALAKAGTESYSYQFLNGSKMTTSVAASVAEDKDDDIPSGFTSTSGSFHGTDSQIKLTDEVQHALTYKVYTNTGVLAIEADQTLYDLTNNNWKPVLPESARTPLLNIDQYRYYEQNLSVANPDTLGKALPLLYGIYDDIIYTHYTPYSENKTDYLVPNVRNATDADPVARDSKSNDAPLGLNGTRLYNIIWYQDDMMKSDGDNITKLANQELQNAAAFEWVLESEGDDENGDPYAIKIKSKDANKYIHAVDATTELSTTATTFMLLNREGYNYGVLAKTGDKNTMLSGYGNELTTGAPNEFIIFALSTFKVIYHLIIANIGHDSESIPYAKADEHGNKIPSTETTISFSGSTYRDLVSRDFTNGEATHTYGDKYQLGVTLGSIGREIPSNLGIFSNPTNDDIIYCYSDGRVSLGDKLKVPSVFYRPNVNYDFYIGGIYASDGTGGTGTDATDIAALNNKYKGLKVTNLGEDSKLLDKIVFVNVVYNFLGGLDTNSGSDFVKSVSHNKWYTFETSNETPMLAEYTGSLQTKSGYATHYTNDYLWTPVGDPYGFKMYNRYDHKNVIGDDKVMTTAKVPYKGYSPTSEELVVEMGADVDAYGKNAVYELLTNNSTTEGYFLVHPVVNLGGLQYYINNNSSTGKTGKMTLSITPTEWTFGLSEDVMRPYYLAAGYVGGLNAAGKAKYEEKAAIEDQFNRLIALQDVVYNHDNDNAENDPTNPNYIVHYTPGYYRLHSQPGSSDITTPRYASGYTHKIELTDGPGAIPLHFYEVPKYTFDDPVFSDLGIANTDYTGTAATRGDIPLVTVDKDPASIFKFTGDANSATMSTQGLYVNQNKMDENSGTPFEIIDIGGGVIALQNVQNETTNFLNYNQKSTIYDLKFNTATQLNTDDALESTRWCMQPVQKAEEPGDGEMGLQVLTNDDGKGNYLTTFCAPFDVLLTKKEDEAFVLPPSPEGDGWPTITPPATAVIHLKKIGKYNTGANGCPTAYQESNQFIPAGTPVIIRTLNKDGYVTMALPNATPLVLLAPVPCVFSGKYLEQMLNHGSDYVYAFGKSLGTFTLDGDFTNNGLLSTHAVVSTDVGFYVNANPNKEKDESRIKWTRNNKYVYANKIFYRSGSSGASSRELTRCPEFIPVVFDEDDDDDEPIEESLRQQVFNGCVYDLQGRCVATEEMVKDGTWRRNLKHGIYILNGKKVYVK